MSWPVIGCWLGTALAGGIMSGVRSAREDWRGAAVCGIIVGSLNIIMDLLFGIWPIAIINGAVLAFWLRVFWRNRRDKRRAKDLIGAKTAMIKARMAQKIAERRIPAPGRI